MSRFVMFLPLQGHRLTGSGDKKGCIFGEPFFYQLFNPSRPPSQILTENLRLLVTSGYHQDLRRAQTFSKLSVEAMRTVGHSSTWTLPLVTVAQVLETG